MRRTRAAGSMQSLALAICFGFLLLFSTVASALPKQSRWFTNDDLEGLPRTSSKTYQEACAKVVKLYRDKYPTLPITLQGYYFYPDDPQGLNQVRCDIVGFGGGVIVEYIIATNVKYCPVGSIEDGGGCICESGRQEDLGLGACVVPVVEPAPGGSGSAGMCTPNPILPASGEKYRFEVDFSDSGPAPLEFARIYRSTWATNALHDVGPLGKTWGHSHARILKALPEGAPTNVTIVSEQGTRRTFAKSTGATSWTPTNNIDTLSQNPNGSWIYRRTADDAVFTFDTSGKLQTASSRNGWATSYSYDAAGQLATISNSFGRTLSLGYNTKSQLSSLTTPDARVIYYSYDAAGRLSNVTYPDGKSRGFLYEDTNFLQALTGIIDESGARFANFSYDSRGRAIDSSLAGLVDRYQVSYPSQYTANIVDPLGTSRTYEYRIANGRFGVGTSSLPSGDSGADAASRTLNIEGDIATETDFKGVRTSYGWTRGVLTEIAEAEQASGFRTTRVSLHPTFSLPEWIDEDQRFTTFQYDAVGNLLNWSEKDTSSGITRSSSRTYNNQNLVETATDPNGAVTHYTYDTRGNVLTVTNALGHVRTFSYDSANRVLSNTAPNGLITTYTYDARDRLVTQAVGGLTTALSYKPYGSVETATLPNGLVLTYVYDAAHRMTGWSSNRGESGIFTLDAMGNRTSEQVKDSSGAVAWSVVRTISNLNRLASEVKGPNEATSFAYDANGNLTAKTNGLSQSTQYGLDALRRVETITDASNASATLYRDRFDAIKRATDFNGLTTWYNRNAWGRAATELSPDSGSSSTEYDGLGLPVRIADALGQATSIVRDALGRPTSVVFADGKTTTLRYDLTANSKGYLSEIIDRSGTTEYTRDALGRVTLKKQTLANGSVQQVSYAYNSNGTLASIGYPNGGTLSHVYDATGRLTGLNWNGTPLVSGIAWNPLGQPTAWTWAFTTGSSQLTASRSYDTGGRLTSTEFSSYGYDAAGRITSLTQNLWQPGDADPTHSTIANANVTWSVGYDAVGRITSFNATGNTAGFGYDANGNRSSSTRGLNGQTTSRTYTVGGSSNQLTGFTQTINGSSNTSVTYGYNANGDLLTDGLRSYTYDAEGRLAGATMGATDVSPTTRYAHNALGQRVFKTEPLYPPIQGDEADPGFMASLIAFFTKLWSPNTTQAERLGYAYIYEEQGTLIAEVGSGGANSAGQSQYIYLPTGNGPMPIAAIVNGNTYAIHSDHLNTPRKLTNANGQAAWQWSYSAFGEDKPTTAKNRFANLETTPNAGTTNVSEVKFNLRYPGQYADEESGLFYNYFRSYDAKTGRYSQPDPIGLDGGWNRFGYVDGNPLQSIDPEGLASKIGRKPTDLEPLDGGGGSGVGGGGRASTPPLCPPAQAPLTRIHPPETIKSSNKSGYEYWSKKPTDDIVKSLRPGQEEPLTIKPDGRIFQGNTRALILEERGFDINKLPREVYK